MPPPFEAAAALGIACRAMTDEDLPFVARLYASTRADELAATGWPEEMRAQFLDQQHRAQHRHYRSAWPEGEWLILEQDGAPIGRLYLGEDKASVRLIDISLIPESRGAGLGGGILADLLRDAAVRGKSVVLHVEKGNRARRLYERLGFAAVEDKGAYDRMVRPAPS